MKTKRFIVSVIILTMLFITCSKALASSYAAVTSLEAPQNLRVEVQTYEDGTPYFNLIWTNPQSIKDLFKAAKEKAAFWATRASAICSAAIVETVGTVLITN